MHGHLDEPMQLRTSTCSSQFVVCQSRPRRRLSRTCALQSFFELKRLLCTSDACVALRWLLHEPAQKRRRPAASISHGKRPSRSSRVQK
jgi:hypothetical protein